MLMLSIRKKFHRVLTTLLLAYGLLLLCGCMFQRKLLYFPARLSSAEAEEYARQAGFSAWKNAAGETIGWKMPAAQSATGSVLVVHGNGGSATHRSYFAHPIHEAGAWDVFVLEYPGYGVRGGAPGLKSWLAAAEEAIAHLPTNQPIFVVSESLGTGVAAHLARKFPKQIAGLVMIVPYDSLPSLAQHRMPLLLPYVFLRDRFEPAKWLRDYRGPIKVVIAGRDEIIPPKYGQRLFDSYAGPKSVQIFPEAGHNDVGEQSPEWWRETFETLSAARNDGK